MSTAVSPRSLITALIKVRKNQNNKMPNHLNYTCWVTEYTVLLVVTVKLQLSDLEILDLYLWCIKKKGSNCIYFDLSNTYD